MLFLRESSGIPRSNSKQVKKGDEVMLIKIKSESGRVAVNVRIISRLTHISTRRNNYMNSTICADRKFRSDKRHFMVRREKNEGL